jgi:hypothetical protein
MAENFLQIFLFIAGGILLRQIIGDRSKPLITLVLFVIFPAVILRKIPGMALVDAIALATLAGSMLIAVSVGLVWLLARRLKLDRATTASLMLVASLGNTSFVGFPYIKGLLGGDALGYAVIYDIFASFFPLILVGTVITMWGAHKKTSAFSIIKELLRFPPFVVLLAAMLIPGDFFPQSADTFFGFCETVLTPLTTLAIGLRMDITKLRGELGLAFAALGIKMGVQPLLLGGLLWCCFDLTHLMHQTFLLESAMPPMVMAAVFAINGGLKGDLAINAVFLGILVSFASVPLLTLLF